MFDLEAAIRAWRDELASHRSLSRSDLEELEDHLRCTYECLVGRGLDPVRAWARAREGLGASAELSEEFRKAEGVAWRRLLSLGWAMFALAFFLPVHQYGDTLFHVSAHDGFLPGIQAFLVALQSGWIGIASALTNFVMALTTWRVVDRRRGVLVALAAATAAAFLVNATWVWQGADMLRIGYFLWWGSYGLVAAGLALRARSLSTVAQPITST